MKPKSPATPAAFKPNGWLGYSMKFPVPLKIVPFDHYPAAECKQSFGAAPLFGNGRTGGVKYAFELIQQPAAVEPLGRFVVGEIRFGEEFHIARVVLIQLDDAFNQGVQVRKIRGINEAARVEVFGHARITPVN